MVGIGGYDYVFSWIYLYNNILFMEKWQGKWGQRLPKHRAQLRAWAPVPTGVAVETASSSDLKPREDNKDNWKYISSNKFTCSPEGF